MPLPLNTDSQGVPYLAYDSTRDVVYSEAFQDTFASVSVGFASTNGGAVVMASRSAANYKRRLLTYHTTINVTTTWQVQTVSPQGAAMTILTFTVVAGNVTPQTGYVNATGAFADSGTNPTKTTGDFSAMDTPLNNTIALVVTSSGAASGACDSGFVQLT